MYFFLLAGVLSTTPLHESIRGGRIQPPYKIVDFKGLIYTRDTSGATPLHVALETGDGRDDRGSLVRYLLGAGAPLDARDGQSRLPIHVAALHPGKGLWNLNLIIKAYAAADKRRAKAEKLEADALIHYRRGDFSKAAGLYRAALNADATYIGLRLSLAATCRRCANSLQP